MKISYIHILRNTFRTTFLKKETTENFQGPQERPKCQLQSIKAVFVNIFDPIGSQNFALMDRDSEEQKKYGQKLSRDAENATYAAHLSIERLLRCQLRFSTYSTTFMPRQQIL